MKDYSVNLKQLDPALFNNGIAKRNQGVSEAERKFLDWVRVNAKEGVTYVSPEGHLFDGTGFKMLKQFIKQIDATEVVNIIKKFKI